MFQDGAGDKSGKESRVSSEAGAPTRVDITASALPSGHYDPKNDVILRVEAMSASETRVSYKGALLSYSLVCIGAVEMQSRQPES